MPGVPDIHPAQLALYGLALIAIAVLGSRYLNRDDGEAGARAAPPPQLRVERAGGGKVTIHVAGAVRRPGVYRLRVGARVTDAIDEAGGARPRADLGALNLAAKLEDGRQVLVPERTPRGTAATAGTGSSGSASTSGGAATPPAPPVNLNVAGLDELDQLDGVGPVTARKIIEYREAHGGFGSVEELGQVPGIGEKRMSVLRERVQV